MPWTSSAPRVLLRQLREVMARPGVGQAKQEEIQARLDRIVRLIAANMVAEVCSIYVRLADGSFELYATEGLRKEAVHTTHMKQGEGLVGLVARSGEHVNLPDAQSHPAFSYRPETGEEIYQSFLGMPIIRGGRTIGVLTVQNAIARAYSEEEVEVLQTIAMVTAEMMSNLLESLNVATAEARRGQSQTIKGITMSDGIALGHIVLHEPRVSIAKLFAEDVNAEQVRLDAALGQLRETVDAMFSDGEIARAGEHRDVLEAYRMFAHDQGWMKRLHEAVAAGLTAEAAVERVQSNQRARTMRQSDPFWRERLHDLDDLANRLLRLLTGRSATAAGTDLPRDTILVARTMGPAELLDYDRKRVRGLVLADGGASSHVAIVAKALGIPAIGYARDVLEEVDPGDPAVLDAESGVFHVRPSLEVIRAYADKARFRARRQAQYEKLRDTPAVTKDGLRVALHVNAGLLVDLPHLTQSGADGIGLYRTELEFMVSSTFPRIAQQTDMYKKIIRGAGAKPVTFRSLDVGGDKILPYLQSIPEENPALGWRAIRIALDRPGLFRTQIRALLSASAGRELRLMLPFVTQVSEFVEARKLIDKDLAHLRRHGRPGPSKIALGAMIEVPAILWQLDEILCRVDFISVGSNDLLQFIFAADRSNNRVSGRFDVLSPPALRVLRHIVVQAEKHKVPVTLCGEMAGRPLEALALIGLGFQSISMAPASVGPVKAMILAVSAAEIQRYLLDLVDHGREDIRDRLKDFARAHDIPL
ncbi:MULTISPECIES: phosphoenolpyruvate--protein phosphotransferase [Rhodomicrobium]|uniref:phosphoenolpyruvate--protein phosphotransferase n=1 Tax=Rhodomicrobium TaxID=1068 RepID=UPI000B4B7DD7|nr:MULTISPECIES: phosphoenolpyruvate--protein phosphotransferase [Rhodomicrobium]